MNTQAAVAQWKREHAEELIRGNCGCLMTLGACKARQAARKNYEVPDDEDSAIAYEFLVCEGDRQLKIARCEHFNPKTSKVSNKHQRFTRQTPEGRNRFFASYRKRIQIRAALNTGPDVNAQYIGELFGKLHIENPKAFAWRAKLNGGRWKI